jgi:hypothetical protein
MLLTFSPIHSNASTSPESTPLSSPKSEASSEADALFIRLNEIKTMDKSDLKSSEKKDLRMEVRTTKHSLREIGGGVYLSGGAIILIALILIILL